MLDERGFDLLERKREREERVEGRQRGGGGDSICAYNLFILSASTSICTTSTTSTSYVQHHHLPQNTKNGFDAFSFGFSFCFFPFSLARRRVGRGVRYVVCSGTRQELRGQEVEVTRPAKMTMSARRPEVVLGSLFRLAGLVSVHLDAAQSNNPWSFLGPPGASTPAT